MGVAQDITERRRIEKERDVISEVAQSVNQTANLDELLASIHRSLCKVVYAENCFVSLYDKETGLFSRSFHVDQRTPKAPPAQSRKSCSAYVCRTGVPLLMNSEKFQRLVAQGEVELVGTPAPSWLGVPLKTASETLGVLVVQHYDMSDVYSREDVDFLTSVGTQIALAIERKQAEEAVVESERRFRDLFYDAPVGYHEIDIEGRITCVNTTELMMLGYSSEEMIGHHVWDFILEAGVAKEKFAEKLAGNKPLRNVERSFRRKDGTFIALQLDDQMLKDQSGRITGIRATMQDITERKLIEQELKENELQLIEAQHIALLGSWAWDINSDTMSWSEALYHIYRLRHEDGPSSYEGCIRVVHPDDRERVVGMVQTAIRTGQGCFYEHRIIWPDQSVRFHHQIWSFLMRKESWSAWRRRTLRIMSNGKNPNRRAMQRWVSAAQVNFLPI